MTSHVSTLADLGGPAGALDLDITDLDVTRSAGRDRSTSGSADAGSADAGLDDAGPDDDDADPDDSDSDLTPVVAPPSPVGPRMPEGLMDGGIVEELTNRLPTSELVKIIKGALECGRRNRPFTESDLLRTMTFGSTTAPMSSRGRPGRG